MTPEQRRAQVAEQQRSRTEQQAAAVEVIAGPDEPVLADTPMFAELAEETSGEPVDTDAPVTLEARVVALEERLAELEGGRGPAAGRAPRRRT